MLQCPQVQVCFFMCMCVAMVCILAHMVSLGAYFISLVQWLISFLCFLCLPCERVAGHVPQVLPYRYGTSRGQRLQVKGHGGVSSTFKCILIHTAGKLGLDVTSVLGSSLYTIIIHQAGDSRHYLCHMHYCI